MPTTTRIERGQAVSLLRLISSQRNLNGASPLDQGRQSRQSTYYPNRHITVSVQAQHLLNRHQLKSISSADPRSLSQI